MAKDEDDIEPAALFVGDWIEFRNLKPANVSRQSGVSESYISMISHGGKKNVGILILTKLSQAIGVPVQRFFEPPPHLGAPVAVKRQEMASLGDIRQRVHGRAKRGGK